jgi:transposase
MYIRKAIRRYKDKTYANYVLVESVRTPKGPRQKTVCNLGDLTPRPAAEWLKLAHKIEQALCDQPDLLAAPADPEVERIAALVRARQAAGGAEPVEAEPVEVGSRQAGPKDAGSIAVLADRVATERHREVGPVHVGLTFWRRLGLDRILEEVGLDARGRELTCAMVLNRLIAPRAEHAMPAWFRRTALDDLLDRDLGRLGEDPLYGNMDRLYPHRRAIETALVARERSLFNLDPAIYLYDLTSTYFEGRALANPKAKRGYSRDKRPDCKQVLVALAIGREGFPVGHEVLAGNIQDRTTLEVMLDRLADTVGLEPGATVVVDRGMAFDENLDQLRQRKLHYIVASRQPERDQWLAEFADADGFEAVVREPSPRNPSQQKSAVKVKAQRIGEQTIVLCHSAARIDKDRAIREKQEARLIDDLDRLTRRIADGKLVKPLAIGKAIGRLQERYPRVARYWRIDYCAETKRFTAEPDEAARAKAAALDGCYILKTDRDDLDAAEAWRTYMLLTRVENAFRTLKSPLAERPIFHQLERRVETHIFLCLLAYHLLVAIEKTLLDQAVHTSWTTIRDRLASHQIATVVLPTTSGATLRIRQASTPEPEHREIYRLLNVTEQPMAPKRTWSEP